jgi:hypothetical protein
LKHCRMFPQSTPYSRKALCSGSTTGGKDSAFEDEAI